MRNERRLSALVCAALFASLAPLHAQGSAERGLGEGQFFPDLVLPSVADGKPRSFAEFRGRRLLVLVFASW